MPRYIDADIFEVVTLENKSEEFIDGVQYILEKIDEQPDADVVEVVRCKDCKHRRNTPYSSFCLPAYGLKRITDLNSFCSYGERKE